jgi:hypothetical protein
MQDRIKQKELFSTPNQTILVYNFSVMIDSETLNPILLEAFTRKTTWFEASTRFGLDDLIETFYATRERVTEAIADITDPQAAYASPVHLVWSISESITHLIYSQGFYHNKLLDITTSELPHVIEAARGFGEGAKTGVPVAELRQRLAVASGQIRVAIEDTRRQHDPDKFETNEFFGVCNYKTWVLLLLGHEVDHLRQIIVMRRLARTEQG